MRPNASSFIYFLKAVASGATTSAATLVATFDRKYFRFPPPKFVVALWNQARCHVRRLSRDQLGHAGIAEFVLDYGVHAQVQTFLLVTYFLQGATCSGRVTSIQTWRSIPEPEYQRLFGCFEFSTRTAMTLGLSPNFRDGVRSRLKPR